MKLLLSYFKSSYIELKKVVWPERQEVGKIAISIVLFVVLLALLMWLYDSFFGWAVYNLVLMWK